MLADRGPGRDADELRERADGDAVGPWSQSDRVQVPRIVGGQVYAVEHVLIADLHDPSDLGGGVERLALDPKVIERLWSHPSLCRHDLCRHDAHLRVRLLGNSHYAHYPKVLSIPALPAGGLLGTGVGSLLIAAGIGYAIIAWRLRFGERSTWIAALVLPVVHQAGLATIDLVQRGTIPSKDYPFIGMALLIVFLLLLPTTRGFSTR